VKISTNK